MRKKGFTLVELLASITILALLALIAIPAISKQIKNGKNDLYNSQIENIKSAALAWGTDNLFKLPEDDTCITVTLGYLKELGYIDNSVINLNNNEKFSDDGVFVNISKKNNQHVYEVKTSGSKCDLVDENILYYTGVYPVAIKNVNYSGSNQVNSQIDKSAFNYIIEYSDGTTSIANYPVTVSPKTIREVGKNTVEVSYTEKGVTVSVPVSIVGTEKEIVNLFDANDPDMLIGGRIKNSTGDAVYVGEGQLVTGFISASAGDRFNLITDKDNKLNDYTGSISLYDNNKKYLSSLTYAQIWSWSNNNKNGFIILPSSFNGNDYSSVAYARFVCAYNELDSIVIYKD